MKHQKQKNNNITKQELADILDQKFRKNQKSLLNSIDKRLEVHQESMAIMVGNAFQATQDLFVEKFNQIDKRFDGVNKNIKELHQQVQKNNLNLVDVVRKEEFDKLESRVVTLEEAGSVKKS